MRLIIISIYIALCAQFRPGNAYHVRPAAVQPPMYGQSGLCQVDTSHMPSISTTSAYVAPMVGRELQCGELIKCYAHKPNTAIANGGPFERRSEISCDQCLRLCEEKRIPGHRYNCLAVIYDYGRSVCDLYAVMGENSPHCLAALQGYHYFRPTGQCETLPPTEAPIILTTTLRPEQPSFQFTCPANTKPKQFLIEGYSSTSESFKPILAENRAQCFSACLENMDAKHEGLPLEGGCQTSEFIGKECRLSSSPLDIATIKQDATSALMTLRCYSNLRPCSQPYRFYPQHVLVGYARQVTDAVSEDDCVQQCLQNEIFRCKSGMFFAEDKGQNCILNTETSHSRNELFTTEEEYAVVFFDLDCVAENLKVSKKSVAFGKLKNFQKMLKDHPDITGWTEWSPCSKLTAKRYRYKRCAAKDVRSCQRQMQACNLAA